MSIDRDELPDNFNELPTEKRIEIMHALTETIDEENRYNIELSEGEYYRIDELVFGKIEGEVEMFTVPHELSDEEVKQTMENEYDLVPYNTSN